MYHFYQDKSKNPPNTCRAILWYESMKNRGIEKTTVTLFDIVMKKYDFTIDVRLAQDRQHEDTYYLQKYVGLSPNPIKLLL